MLSAPFICPPLFTLKVIHMLHPQNFVTKKTVSDPSRPLLLIDQEATWFFTLKKKNELLEWGQYSGF